MSGNKLRHPTVLAVHLRDDGVMGGCEQYRIRIPYEAICNRVPGSVLSWAPIGKVQRWAGDLTVKTRPTDYDIMTLVRHRPLPYGEYGTPEFEQLPQSILQALSGMGIELQGRSHMLDVAELIRRSKQKLVLEYDDDHWTGSRDLGHYEHLDLVREFLGKASAITVTTPYMRKITQEYAPSVPIYILPNCVVWDEWQGHKRWKRWDDDWVVIALTGSITHDKDWMVLADVIPRVLRENGNVAFLMLGFVPHYFKSLPYDYPARVYADDRFRPYEAYPQVIRQADIVLCPVDPADQFNWAKSGIKATEGFAAGRELSDGKMGGAAVIASPLDYYKEVLGHGKRGIIAEHTAKAWYEAITTFVRDKGKRERSGRLGRRWVYKNHNIDYKWGLWWDAYTEIYRRTR